MTQNMFQEGLYHVFFKQAPPTGPQGANQVELTNARIHRWFGSVVSTRLLVSGVVQLLSAVVCILTTVTHACVSYNCSIAMTTPVWSSLFYVAAGALALEVQRKANKLKIVSLMILNVFSFLFGSSALLVNGLSSAEPAVLSTSQQSAGSLVAKGTSVAFSVLCFLLSVYVLFLSWRGLRRYSSPQAYNRLAQDPDERHGPLEDEEVFTI